MTRVKIGYAVVLIAAFIFYVAYIDTLSLILLALTLAFPVVSFVILKCVCEKIKIGFVCEKLAERKKAQVKYHILLENKTIFPLPQMIINISYYNGFDHKLQRANITVPFRAKSSQTVIYGIVCEYCGLITAEVESVELFDYLLMFRKKIKTNLKSELLIIPETCEPEINIQTHDVGNHDDEYSTVKPGDDPSEIFALREYRPGDRQNQIHWKLSSKLDDYIVKEYSLPVYCSTLLLFDFYVDFDDPLYLKKTDALVETLVALSSALVMAQTPHYIGWFCNRDKLYHREKIRAEEDCIVLLRKLFRSGCYDDAPNALYTYNKEYVNTYYSHIVYAAPSLGRYQAGVLNNVSDARKLSCLYMTANENEKVHSALSCECNIVPIVCGKITSCLSEFVL